jgi:type I restriction enzyme, R subunit
LIVRATVAEAYSCVFQPDGEAIGVSLDDLAKVLRRSEEPDHPVFRDAEIRARPLLHVAATDDVGFKELAETCRSSCLNAHLSVDLLLSVNGLPVATAERKNQFTGQTVEHAKTQYREDRDPREPLFAFKRRALVHFAMDPDAVLMTTRLDGKRTVFLPFQQGPGLDSQTFAIGRCQLSTHC